MEGSFRGNFSFFLGFVFPPVFAGGKMFFQSFHNKMKIIEDN